MLGGISFFQISTDPEFEKLIYGYRGFLFVKGNPNLQSVAPGLHSLMQKFIMAGPAWQGES